MAVTIQMRQRGTLTLPAKLRAKYRLEEGDVFTLVDLDGAFLLLPKLSVVPKLTGEIERLREEAGLAVDDLLEGLDKERQLYNQERQGDGG
jgi:bifunctional DNA-binding transcriptional regulator/antitoxin component of YhaV-PrlF toxin-antitoxin module